MVTIPKGTHFDRILTFSVLQIAAVVVAVSCVVAYMVLNDLSKGRWAFFIFIACLAVFFAVLMTVIYHKDIPRRHPDFKWPIMLSVPALILAVLHFIGAIVTAAHIDHSCMKYCALVTVSSISAFFLTFLFLSESLMLLTKSHEEKARRKTAMVGHMETQI